MDRKQKQIITEAVRGTVLDMMDRVGILENKCIELLKTGSEGNEKHLAAVIRDVTSRISIDTNVILFNLGRLDFALNPK